MDSNIRIINLKNNKEISIQSRLKDSGIICTNFNEGAPQGDFQKIKGVNQLGQTINSTSLSEREIILEGIIIGENRTQVEVIRNQLVSILNPLDNILLKYTDDNINKEIMLRPEVVPVFSVGVSTEQLESFMINFNAAYPLWVDQKEILVDIQTWESNFEFEFELSSEGVEFAKKGPNEISFINTGHMEAPIEMYFTAPALNPKIALNNKEYIKVNEKINDGEVLYICTSYGNTRVEIIKSNGDRKNASGYIDIFSSFFKLPIGENTISYSTDGDYIPQSVLIKYKNQYLSL